MGRSGAAPQSIYGKGRPPSAAGKCHERSSWGTASLPSPDRAGSQDAMYPSSTRHRPHITQVLVATALLVGLTAISADAQSTLTRVEGAWDLPESDPRVINVYELAAAGHENRPFAVTKVAPIGARSPDAKAQPQFLPVTNVRGEARVVAKFFNAQPGQMISLIGLVRGQGASLTLNEVTVRPVSPAGAAPPAPAAKPLP